MGAKYNWKIFNLWLELSPFVYIRLNRKTKDGFWSVVFEYWA